MALTQAQIDALNRGDLNELSRALADVGFGTLLDAAQRGVFPSNSISGPELSAGSLRLLAVVGRNGAGACTATGAKVGDTVVGIVDVAGATVTAASFFEATVTVADQIQQSSATDRSAIKHVLLVVAKS